MDDGKNQQLWKLPPCQQNYYEILEPLKSIEDQPVDSRNPLARQFEELAKESSWNDSEQIG